MGYPGRAIRKGDARVELVREVQLRLVGVGCGPLETDGIFGDETESSVQLFQTRRSLQADGVIGPLTWDVLFDEPVTVNEQATSPILKASLEVALSQLGIRETKGQPNRGPEVDAYIRSVGLNPTGGHSWCQAFVYWCFDKAASTASVANPCVQTGGVLAHWAKSPRGNRVYAQAAFDDPSTVSPGAIFIVDHGSGRGHTGLVLRISAGEIDTIEGNTNERGSREGDGVYRKTRSLASVNVGFIDYGRSHP